MYMTMQPMGLVDSICTYYMYTLYVYVYVYDCAAAGPCRFESPVRFSDGHAPNRKYIYIYIYIERERGIDTYIYIYIEREREG